jgi:3-oxoacyl-[acyl-carrier protein] reductase
MLSKPFLGKIEEAMVDSALKEKVAVVTGANNPYGIGAAVAKALAAQGAHIFLHYFRSKSSKPQKSSRTTFPGEEFYYSQQSKSPEGVIKSISDLGGRAYAWEADLSESRLTSESSGSAAKT